MEDRKKLAIVAAVSASAGLLFFVLAGLAILCVWSRRKGAKTQRKREDEEEGRRREADSTEERLVMFYAPISYKDVVEATGRFDEEHVLSRSSRYGTTFKACFDDGSVYAVRRLADGHIAEESAFRREADALGKLRHPNLTVLRGYYTNADLRLLVYDYMPNGDLATLLQEASHDSDARLFNWPMRHVIALGLARALAFLHSQFEVPIAHGDIQPANVHFDADFEPHLSDFGLQRLASSVNSGPDSKSGGVVGSFGYVSPEAKSGGGMPTKEGDVYSFGIVLLELLTGKRAVMFMNKSKNAEEDEEEEEEEDIVKWVKKKLQSGKISEVFDPALLEVDDFWEEFLVAVKVALLCTVLDPLDRPSMSEVVTLLQGCRVGAELCHDLPSSSDPTTHASPV